MKEESAIPGSHYLKLFHACDKEVWSMTNAAWKVLSYFILLLALSILAKAQTATYHLHNEASSTPGNYQLKTAGPDTAGVAVQSADLKNAAPGEYFIRTFDTQAGVPKSTATDGTRVTSSYQLAAWACSTCQIVSDGRSDFNRCKLEGGAQS
jgi:hypothetical protein